jgi:hypothetical protein
LGDNECILTDVLGGSWDAPADRWATMQAAIDAWSFDNDTMPSLVSQPMQIVGWATLTLATDSVDEAFEFGRLAQLNVDASFAALDCPSAG